MLFISSPLQPNHNQGGDQAIKTNLKAGSERI